MAFPEEMAVASSDVYEHTGIAKPLLTLINRLIERADEDKGRKPGPNEGTTWASQGYLAARLGCSESQVEKLVQLFARDGWLLVSTYRAEYLCGWGTKLEPRFQFDFLLGPAFGLELSQGRNQHCVCGRRKNIERLRAMRGL